MGRDRKMKWLAKSFILAVVGLCVTTAVLVRPLGGQLAAWSLLPRRAEAYGASAGTGKATPSMVAAMHAQNAAELQGTVAQIRDEFGIGVAADRFSSHHVARDYLERLRLAEQARALGLEVDPHAFGDDACMRRHIEALGLGLDATGPPFTPDTGPLLSGTTGHRDCILLYGHKYHRDADGRYVRADGTVLQTSLLRSAQRGRSAPGPQPKNDTLLQAGDVPHDLDALLQMLAPEQGTRP